jgi:hypothetical protein
MSYQLSTRDAPGYVHFVVTGTNSPEALRGYLREALAICANRRCTALLIEENLAGPGLGLVDIYSIVIESSEAALAQRLKVAFVDVNPEHARSSTTFAETVARNRGVNVRAFATLAEAQEWLRRS